MHRIPFAPPLSPRPPGPRARIARRGGTGFNLSYPYFRDVSRPLHPASQSSRAHYQFRNSADPTVTGVMAAGRHLVNALNSLGIGTMHETTIHTLPNINHSYGNSEKTVREILSRHKDLKMVIDLHRDAGGYRGAVFND